MMFWERSHLHASTCGQSSKCPCQSCTSYSENLPKITHGGSYTENRFSVETKWPLLQTPSRTFPAGERSVPGFRAGKDRLTLSLGTKAAGDATFEADARKTPQPLRIMLHLLCLCSRN